MLLMTDIEYGHMTMYIGRNKYETLSKYDDYFTSLKSKDIDEIFEHLEAIFRENGFDLPRLIYYNMRKDMEPSIRETPHLVEIVGYVEDILERVYKNDYYIETEEDKFNRLKESERYSEVYKIIDDIDEIYI